MSNSLLINAAELLRRPGSERRLELGPTVAELGIVESKFDPSATVAVSLRLESLTDGVVVVPPAGAVDRLVPTLPCPRQR